MKQQLVIMPVVSIDTLAAYIYSKIAKSNLFADDLDYQSWAYNFSVNSNIVWG